MQYYVYLLTNRANRVLYTGVTNNLGRRLTEHKDHKIDGFTARYHVDKLIYYEIYHTAREAISREKQIKGWTREKKEALIAQKNPNWEELKITV